jgi:type IV secretory pathway VirB2 component (pilin)
MLTPKREGHGDRRSKSTSRSASAAVRRPVAERWRGEKRFRAARAAASRPRPRRVHGAVLVLAVAVGSYAVMLGLMWLTFARTGEGTFVMLVVSLVFASFAVVPLIIRRLARQDAAAESRSLREYLVQSMDTLTGPLNARAALVQIVVVPALLTLCLAGIAIAMALAR